jgi:hypothetical protein
VVWQGYTEEDASWHAEAELADLACNFDVNLLTVAKTKSKNQHKQKPKPKPKEVLFAPLLCSLPI